MIDDYYEYNINQRYVARFKLNRLINIFKYIY